MGQVYDNLLKESMRNLDELLTVITAGQLRMSDDQRIASIDRIHAEMEDKLHFLKSYNGEKTLLGVNRAREAHDTKTLQQLYGLQ